MTFRSLRRTARWVPLLCAPGFAACYSYVPVDWGAPARGTPIRAEVHGAPTYEVGNRQLQDIATVNGQVILWQPDTLALSVFDLHSAGGQSFDGYGFTVKVPQADVSRVAMKRLDHTRTILFSVGLAVAVVAIGGALGGALGSGPGPENGGATK